MTRIKLQPGDLSEHSPKAAQLILSVCCGDTRRHDPSRGKREAEMVKKVLTWALVAFLVFFVVSRPTAAAQVVKSIGSGIKSIGVGFGDFFSNLVS
jgi:hypothetical protein